MKQRLLVMNGQRILQNHDGKTGWKTAGRIKPIEAGIKPGIYSLYLAEDAITTNKKYDGLILMVDKEKGNVYQKVDKKFIIHKLESFKFTPTPGKNVSIQYENNVLNLYKIDVLAKKKTHKI